MEQGVSIVTYTVATERAEELTRRVREHLLPAARQLPGYQGFLLVDQGDGKRLALVLFASVAAAQAAPAALTPVGREHTYALMTSPALGTIGQVIVGDGIFVP
jgi:hypothetical protein